MQIRCKNAKKDIPGQIPDTGWIYRIIHRNNLRTILERGIFSVNHPDKDPDYIFIGDHHLTRQRTDFPIPLEGKGSIGEYVAFYFCVPSPMLLNIKTGHRGITPRPQSEIVYLCCRLDCLEEKGVEWLFTDGHAKNALSSFYTEREDLDKVDWNLRWDRYWRNTEEDPDRQRRKQAEFLARYQVPSACIEAVIVYDETTAAYVRQLIAEIGRNVDVYINPEGKFYY